MSCRVDRPAGIPQRHSKGRLNRLADGAGGDARAEHPDSGETLDYRRILQKQARLIKQAVQGQDDSLRFYPPCAWCEPLRRALGTTLLTEDEGITSAP